MTEPVQSAKARKIGASLCALAWLGAWFAWLLVRDLPAWIPWLLFTAGLLAGLGAAVVAWRNRKTAPIRAAVLGSIAYVPVWQWLVFATDALEWDASCRSVFQIGITGLFFIGLGWVIWYVERTSRAFDRERQSQASLASGDSGVDAQGMTPHALKPLVDDERSPAQQAAGARDGAKRPRRVWNPLDPAAWYYGRHSRRLNQSLTALVSYSLLFGLAVLLLSNTRGCEEIYEMPAGGGEAKQIAQTVKIQRVIRKKFVVNPFSGIKFEVPPIDEVKLQLTEVTEHAYTVGYGEGTGAGFAGGTSRGKVRLIRLEYSGGDWDLNFGVGADLNMLVEYGVRTAQKVAEQTESRTILDLRNFPAGKAPPVVLLTGQKNISVTNAEIKALQQYLSEKHGMLFVSNGGSGHFHQQVLALMNQVAPDVRPVPVPLDDPIHTVPFRLASVPIVAPHGGRDALGWYKDGRWICYYHPGDITDAWCDDHAGVSPDVWEACYQLGVNVLFYAHAENAKWAEAQKR